MLWGATMGLNNENRDILKRPTFNPITKEVLQPRSKTSAIQSNKPGFSLVAWKAEKVSIL